MPPRRRWPLAERLLAACLLSCAVASGAWAAEPVSKGTAQRLVLTVSVDGHVADEPLLARRDGATLWLRTADLRALGLTVKGDTPETALAALSGIEAQLDEAAQTLALVRTRGVQRVNVGSRSSPRAVVTPSGWGAAVNYDLTASRTGRASAAGGLVDALVYGPSGVFHGSAVLRAGQGPGATGFTRLDSNFIATDPTSARQFTLGDVISGTTEQSRAIRLGGIQLATNFDVRPDIITYPVPTIRGSAAVPSAVDLIVNGGRRAAGEVKAGRFALSDVPVQAGVNIVVATRDALGRETRQTVSTYVSRTLLRPGLTAFSIEAGVERRGYATAADRYGAPAAVGSVRQGVTDRVTIEGHGELGRSVRLATAGASVSLGSMGLASASAGISRGGATELAVGYERVGRPISVSARYVRRDGDWRDLAAEGGAATRRSQLAVSLGFDLARFGTLGMTLIDLGPGRSAGRAALPATSFTAATYSVRIARRLSLVANAGGDLRRRRSGYLSFGALMVFGARSSGYAGGLVRHGGTSAAVETSRATLEPGDVGYRLGAARGGVDRLVGGLSYQGPAGRYSADVERTNGVTAARASMRGSVVISDGALLAADQLSGSFAVVDAGGQRGVQVYRDNRPAGVTGRNGKLLVANLRAYEPTKISLDPLQLDDAELVDRTEQMVTPSARAGVPVRFALRRARSGQVRLIDASGAPIPAGARAIINGAAETPVGMEGLLYVADLSPDNRVIVTLRGGATCAARFQAPPGVVARIAPVTCAADRLAARQVSSLYLISR